MTLVLDLFESDQNDHKADYEDGQRLILRPYTSTNIPVTSTFLKHIPTEAELEHDPEVRLRWRAQLDPWIQPLPKTHQKERPREKSVMEKLKQFKTEMVLKQHYLFIGRLKLEEKRLNVKIQFTHFKNASNSVSATRAVEVVAQESRGEERFYLEITD